MFVSGLVVSCRGFCSEVQLAGEVGRRRAPRVPAPLGLLGTEERAPLLPVMAEVAAAAPSRRRRHRAGGVPGVGGSPRALDPETDQSSRMHPGNYIYIHDAVNCSTSVVCESYNEHYFCRVRRKKAQWRAHRELCSYLTMKRASVICQCAWRQSIARRHLGTLRLVLLLTHHLLLAHNTTILALLLPISFI